MNFHNALVDAGWPPFWDVTKPVSSYPGITVNTSKRISGITIDGNTLGIQASHLPDGIQHLQNLQELGTLAIQNVLLETISPRIGDLTSLRSLRLWFNYISNLPASIGNLQNLRTLDVRVNRLNSLPSTIGDLTFLANLTVENNRLINLPDDISKLNNLVNLNISNNQLQTFPISISEIRSLREIRASYNEMSGDIPEIIWDRNENVVDPIPLSLYVDHNNLSGRVLGEDTDESLVDILDISANNFLLQDLLPDYEDLQTFGARVTFMPQNKFGDVQQIILPSATETTAIFVEGYQSLPSNEVQWLFYRKLSDRGLNENLAGTEYPLVRSNDPINQGLYYCKVTNPAMPNLEIISYPVRFILSNEPPVIETDAITFRTGDNPALNIDVSDDFTYFDLLEITYPNETENLQLSSGNIIPKVAGWLGTDLLTVSVTDEQNALTTKIIPITILPEENKAPLVTLPNMIYPGFLSNLPLPLPCEPGTTGCDALYVWEAQTLIDYYIKDDLTNPDNLEYTIKEWQAGSTKNVNEKVFVDITDQQGWMGNAMNTYILANKDTIVSLTLQVKDHEGLTTERPIQLICSTTNPGKPPLVSEIPDQIIDFDTEAFPDLNLNNYVTNDYEENENLLWIHSSDASLTVNLADSIALVKPSVRDTPFAVLVDYFAIEKTNAWHVSTAKVNYRVSEALDIDEFNGKMLHQDVILYPNPVAGESEVYLRFIDRTNADGIITIFNITGQTLLTFPFHNTTSNLSLSLYLNKLFSVSRDKLYFVKTTLSDGSSSVLKLVRM
ncbi:hypothetical protein [uncultured Polaribacter sp.]|uniref:leucine-rich repeat domain-containing protein n=1 Tax=uncultured Polaribacter sp. TaxID=174711 RepID=UPI00262A8570|nr:hypothetical protein [uncultured Polaribacter sp.]